MKKILTILVVIILLAGSVVLIKLRGDERKGNDYGRQTTTETPKIEKTAKDDAPSRVAFGKPITLKLNEKITFTDGLVVALTVLDDSRCPKGVQCIWAGEISATFELSGGKLKNPGEIHLGTVNDKSMTVENYTITLVGGTETSATVNVVSE